MNNINRFSSRRQRLDHAFLSVRLKEAKSYKRRRPVEQDMFDLPLFKEAK